MGQSSSALSSENLSAEQREAETLAASTGALPILQKAFSLLSDSDPQNNAIPLHALQKCFALSVDNSATSSSNEESSIPKELLALLGYVGSAIVDMFFLAEKGGVSWIEFLRGYNKCCARKLTSTSFNNLFKVFAMANDKAGFPTKLHCDSDEDDGKMTGAFSPTDLCMLLWTCWSMSWDSWRLKDSKSAGCLQLPDIDNLVFSAIESCSEEGEKWDFWDFEISSSNVQLHAAKLYMWALNTVPYLPDCFEHFVYMRLSSLTTHEGKMENFCFPVYNICSSTISKTNLLTCGRAWAISLTMRSSMNEEILKTCYPRDSDEINEILLYQSSFHGKGLNRFWSNVEGYDGPVLMVIAGSETNNVTRRWIIGALTHQGFENKESFYGSSGCLYAIYPTFHAISSSGKDKNFVYSHLHTTGRVYDPHPKPVGIAFGGSIGNERIFIDEDFSKVTLRHHAVDKTYKAGTLISNQGYLPLEASILEVEAWGLAGKRAKEVQTSYKKREELFAEQRRKVDLKSFANWEDSPEKMMMDMVSDPSRVRREDR